MFLSFGFTHKYKLVLHLVYLHNKNCPRQKKKKKCCYQYFYKNKYYQMKLTEYIAHPDISIFWKLHQLWLINTNFVVKLLKCIIKSDTEILASVQESDSSLHKSMKERKLLFEHKRLKTELVVLIRELIIFFLPTIRSSKLWH